MNAESRIVSTSLPVNVLSTDYALPVALDARSLLARAWLQLALWSLLGSGLFSLLLVLARAPYTHTLLPGGDFFRAALVVHVDLSVLIWFIAFGGVLWSLNSTHGWIKLGWTAFVLSVIGTLVMVTAPFVADPQPLMSNYVPILRQPWFLSGLLIFVVGGLLVVLRAMKAIPAVGMQVSGESALRFGLNTAAVATMMAVIAFAWTYAQLPVTLDPKAYYELLFWGGGHVLQFTYTLLMLVGWLWLASASGLRLSVSPRVTLVLFALGLIAVFCVPPIYYAYSVTTVEHVKLFTWLMRYGGSLATLPLALAVVIAVLRGPAATGAERPLRAALVTSIILFGIGGGIGFLIKGSDVRIPAHYHGSIVGITLAFMGLTYYLLARLGYGEANPRWAARQPWIYGAGQLLHIVGLVISGGYGVQRKVAGAAQGLESTERIVGMGLMGLGGLIAVAGGALFLLLVFRAVYRGGRREISVPGGR